MLCFITKNKHNVKIQHCVNCETRNVKYIKHINLIDISIKNRTHTQSNNLFINFQFFDFSINVFKIKIKTKNVLMYDFNRFVNAHKITINLNYFSNNSRFKNLNSFSIFVRTLIIQQNVRTLTI